jgi:hypothetical protein
MFIIISRREEENTKYNQQIAQKMANKPPIHPLARWPSISSRQDFVLPPSPFPFLSFHIICTTFNTDADWNIKMIYLFIVRIFGLYEV